MRRTGICVLVVLALLMTACSGSGDETSHKEDTAMALSKQVAELDALPKVSLQGSERESDRDPASVIAGLWRLDPCRLLAPEQGKPGRAQGDPHRCALNIGGTYIELVLGAPLSAIERKQIGATKVKGAKAYVQPGGSGDEGCMGWLPVSQSQTIRVEDGFAECWRVREVLRRVVERIDDPSSRQSVRELPAVQPCPLLEHGLGSKMKGRKVEYGTVKGSYGLDRCTALAKPEAVADTANGGYFASLELETYDSAVPVEKSLGWPADFGTIRGRAVVGDRDSMGDGKWCELRWREATTDVRLIVNSCAQGRRMVKRMMGMLDRSQSRPAVLEGPLLYGADEDDIRAQGACVDYMPLWFGRRYGSAHSFAAGPACHAYVEPEIPDDPAEIVIAAEADPNVTCDIAADAVHEEFGDRLRPTTLEPESRTQRLPDKSPFRVRPCVFVDPQRKIQVKVFLSSDPMPVDEEVRDLLQEDMRHLLQKDAWGTRMHSYWFGGGDVIGFGDDLEDSGYVAVFAGKRYGVSRHGEYGRLPGADTESVADAIIEEHLVEAS